jgi:hypothetical protein
MRKFIMAFLATGALVASGTTGAIAAPNPSETGTGLPLQSCQELGETDRPGNSAESPGSPFNEAPENSPEGGIGGQHYNETSQYDVACFQQTEKGH